MKPSIRKRPAMVLVCVIVAMVIAVALSGTMIQSSLRARRQMQNEWQLEQTRLLLDLGIREVLSEPNVSQPELVMDDALPRYQSGRVTTEVVDEASQTNRIAYQVTATIRSRDQPPVVTRRSRKVFVSKPNDEVARRDPVAKPTNQPKTSETIQSAE